MRDNNSHRAFLPRGRHAAGALVLLASVAASGFLGGCQAAVPEAVPADFLVSFERGPCFGTCPAYILTVFADGSVAYNGVNFVLAEGNRETTLSPEQLAQLHRAVVQADFFDLDDRYEVAATDLPSILTTVSMNGQTKTIYHYGLGCGSDLDLAPPGLCQVEALLEGIAESNGWVSSE